MKTCIRCKVQKPLDSFYKRSVAKDGKDATCIECRLADKDKKAAYDKKRLEENGETIRKKRREYDASVSPERREELLEYKKQYYRDNKDRLCQNTKEHAYKRRREIPEERIKNNLRKRITNVLRGVKKSKKTEDLLGCSFTEFRIYLEERFTEGMSWDNYGLYGWHIDHIIPCSSFKLMDEAEQKRCFHHTNMQPLWAKDNLKKHNKII